MDPMRRAPPSTPAAAIETKGLFKRYGETIALDGLDLEVPRNSIFGFLGPNGAGKSTTMKLLLGLAHPTGGAARVFGLDASRDSLAVRGRVGYLAQEPRFYDYMTARETLRFVLGFFEPLGARETRLRVDEALELVGLARIADRPIRGLSGGERQRLGIAQAWIHRPDLLILDEPAASLDPMGRADVLNILRRLRDRATVFFSTHILDDVQRESDTVAILARGRRVAQAPIQELLTAKEAPTFVAEVRDVDDEARADIERLPWVRSVQVGASERGTTWRVTVTDVARAEADLLRRLLQDPAAVVVEFRRVAFELEDVFLDLVKEGSDAGHANR